MILNPAEHFDWGVKAAAQQGQESQVAECTPTAVLRIA